MCFTDVIGDWGLGIGNWELGIGRGCPNVEWVTLKKAIATHLVQVTRRLTTIQVGSEV
jgi:hypothetical protein